MSPNHSGSWFWWDWTCPMIPVVIMKDLHHGFPSIISVLPVDLVCAHHVPAALAVPSRHFFVNFLRDWLSFFCHSGTLSSLQCICPVQGLTTSTASVARPGHLYSVSSDIVRVKNRWWRERFKMHSVRRQYSDNQSLWKVPVSISWIVFSGLADHYSNTSLFSPPLPPQAPSSWQLRMPSCRFGLKGSSTVRYVL